ncbi:MAG: dihydroneopterin triphosphate diphosphatase [Pseudomonadota bacterium]|nr:MAG: dihydroneopterin triphosphate diphosphatase [Pseudomonadota bacterium]
MERSQFKRPESVLVVVYTRTRKVLLLRRREPPDFWQSVTGSLAWEEISPLAAARRELQEETGLTAPDGLRDLQLTHRFPILPQWRARYAPTVSENLEHAFALELPSEVAINMNAAEHTEYSWFGFAEAAEKATSWTNREVIRKLQAET